jgi:glucan 1,3-beta-glucosidase
MRVHSLLTVCALGGGISQVVGQELRIPWVEAMVASVTQKYADAVTYHGPTGSALAVAKSAEASISSSLKARPTSSVKINERQSAQPYWLESIAHQGISAFHPNPAGYQVFRNVKDFGAKGLLYFLNIGARLTKEQVMV